MDEQKQHDDLMEFIVQSTESGNMSLLSNTTKTGIVYSLKLPNYSQPNFMTLNSNRIRNFLLNNGTLANEIFGIKNIIMKICFTSFSQNGNNVSLPDINYNNYRVRFSNLNSNPMNPQIEFNTNPALNDETIIQNYVHTQTVVENGFSEAVCPSILGYYHFSSNDYEFTNKVNTFFSFFRDNQLDYIKNIAHKISQIVDDNSPNYVGIGFIFMEQLECEPFNNVYRMSRNTTTQEFVVLSKAWYELTRIHNLGICHGDPHFGNIIHIPNYQNYYGNELGKVMIIDYGEAGDKDVLLDKYSTKFNSIDKNNNSYIQTTNYINNVEPILQQLKQTYSQYTNYIDAIIYQMKITLYNYYHVSVSSNQNGLTNSCYWIHMVIHYLTTSTHNYRDELFNTLQQTINGVNYNIGEFNNLILSCDGQRLQELLELTSSYFLINNIHQTQPQIDPATIVPHHAVTSPDPDQIFLPDFSLQYSLQNYQDLSLPIVPYQTNFQQEQIIPVSQFVPYGSLGSLELTPNDFIKKWEEEAWKPQYGGHVSYGTKLISHNFAKSHSIKSKKRHNKKTQIKNKELFEKILEIYVTSKKPLDLTKFISTSSHLGNVKKDIVSNKQTNGKRKKSKKSINKIKFITTNEARKTQMV